ncbi:uncharacterized protein PADG_03439 [Paracoccidioides brasiliensis Pb18]|uniref:Uncharacterized protein n=1 Tax=Paracoccidioides brasiliensis (strain Pb18) TaxID=502780 RepID=C1G569_PARBD|nr:uncharacterized protein PADG_03439 [Paracoccidioides brasiliensis Pb18]EEH47341.1 hypothetical protein PADG_03439 [Paracoccidioides brasiliensis Pb18]
MASLRKLFNVEKTLLQGTSPELIEKDANGLSSDDFPPCRVLSSRSPETNLPRLPHMQNQTFYGIEKQFEDLHDQFRRRPSRALQNKRFRNLESKLFPYGNRRHVDVVEASFPVQHARVPTPISPASMYNEEIADRNIQSQGIDKAVTKYANVISAVYQEDIADRNILLSGGNARARWTRKVGVRSQFTLNNGRSSSSLSYYWDGRPRLWSRTNATGYETSPAEGNRELRVISSDQDLRTHPLSYTPENIGSSPTCRMGVRQYIALRLRTSSPAFSAKWQESNNSPEPVKASNISPDLLPSARDAWKSPRTVENSSNPLKLEVKKPRTISADRPPLKLCATKHASSRLLSPTAARLSGRKNVRDLSINTKLAAPVKTFVKVSGQPPDMTVPTPRREPSASLAEIVNSPLQVATPSAISPKAPSYNVEEIMSMFKQAYMSSSQETRSRPTFETLHDAIVREINSHEAFRQVASEIETMPFPECSPSPIPNTHVEENHSHMRKKPSSKSLSGKEKQAVKFVRRNSVAQTRRNSYAPVKELSFPAIKCLEGGTEEDHSSHERRRRHTYCQPLQTSTLVAPEFPRELWEEAKKANRGLPGNISRPKYTYKLMPDVCPMSSHSIRPKVPPSRQGTSGTSGSSKLSQPRRPSQQTRAAKPETKQKSSSCRNTTAAHTEPEAPKFQFDHVRDEENKYIFDLAPRSRSPSESKTPTSSSPSQSSQTTPVKRLFNTSPQPIVRNLIPLRRSSLTKDLFDSGRFRL